MKVDVFELALLELKREGKLKKQGWIDEFFKRVDTIDKYLSHSDRKKGV